MQCVISFIIACVLIWSYLNIKKRKRDKQNKIYEMLRRHMEDNPLPTGIRSGLYCGRLGSEILNPFRNQYMGNMMGGMMGQHQRGYQHTPYVDPIIREEKVINPTLELTESKDKETE